jgi:hypothetical protein
VRCLPAIHEAIGMLLMLAGLVIASDSKAARAQFLGDILCVGGFVLAWGFGPSLVLGWRWLRGQTNDKTPE